MTRNHFSKKGGPYFINNGFSAHDPKLDSNHKDTKPDEKVFLFIAIGFGILLLTIASLLSAF